MKPTLDEEIGRVAERWAADYTEMTDFSSLPECIKFAIYAGIEAWKRQEPEGKNGRIVSAYICANNYINALTSETSIPPESLAKIAETYWEAVRLV